MEKEFVPYEQAFELAKLNFNGKCFGYYDLESEVHIEISCNLDTNLTRRNFFAAPTYQQAFRWFREKYHIIGEVKFQGGKTTKTAWYDYVIYSEIDWNDENLSEQWKKHEEAELACLRKLIEIVKNK